MSTPLLRFYFLSAGAGGSAGAGVTNVPLDMRFIVSSPVVTAAATAILLWTYSSRIGAHMVSDDPAPVASSDFGPQVAAAIAFAAVGILVGIGMGIAVLEYALYSCFRR